MSERNNWKGKRIAVVGLGPHGEMVEDIKYLIKGGAFVSVYDLRSEARLKNHLVMLRSIGLANYVCGSIPKDDLQDSELIILSHEYPRDSSFLSAIEGKNIPVEYVETLFFRMAPPLTLVGVVGNAGKSTIVSILAPLLEMAARKDEKENKTSQSFFLCDPEASDGLLPVLKKAKNGDILLMPVSKFLMPELMKMRISPHVAIFTSLPHEYIKSPFEILEYQTYNNFLIASDEIIDKTRSYDFKPRAKMLRTKTNIIPPIWDLYVHPHDRMNIALALQAARLFRVTDEEAGRVVEKWKPLRGRIEFVKKVKNIEFYNDSASVLPDSTKSALTTLAKNRNIVLIMGGAENRANFDDLLKVINETVHTVIMLPGSGTLSKRIQFQQIQNINLLFAPNIEEAVRLGRENAKTGDIVLYSPAMNATGHDLSRRERGEKFVRAVRAL